MVLVQFCNIYYIGVTIFSVENVVAKRGGSVLNQGFRWENDQNHLNQDYVFPMLKVFSQHYFCVPRTVYSLIFR